MCIYERCELIKRKFAYFRRQKELTTPHMKRRRRRRWRWKTRRQFM